MAKAENTSGETKPSLLKSHAGHALTYLSLHFEPQIDFTKKLSNLAEAVLKHSKAPHWASTAGRYIIRETNKRFFYLFDHQVFYCQTLGLDPWLVNLEDHLEVMAIASRKMEVTRIKRFGFQVSIQLPLGMAHAEICDLMFGSYVVERQELLSTFGKVDDVLLQLFGYYKEIRSQTIIAPQTAEQSSKHFLSTANLDLFVEEKYTDTCIKEQLERVSHDCLSLTIEMTKEDVPANSLPSLVHDCYEGVENIAEGVVLRIRLLKPKEQLRDGND